MSEFKNNLELYHDARYNSRYFNIKTYEITDAPNGINILYNSLSLTGSEDVEEYDEFLEKIGLDITVIQDYFRLKPKNLTYESMAEDVINSFFLPFEFHAIDSEKLGERIQHLTGEFVLKDLNKKAFSLKLQELSRNIIQTFIPRSLIVDQRDYIEKVVAIILQYWKLLYPDTKFVFEIFTDLSSCFR